MTTGMNSVLSYRSLSPRELRAALQMFVPATASHEERVSSIQAELDKPHGFMIREAMAHWISEHIVPASRLVPRAHERWIPVVRDAMVYVVMNLSSARLAPKILEQLELPPRTIPERRLLCLISKVPGLQKLGQVLARNRHIGPSLRKALIRLENGIRDVKATEIATLIRERLQDRLAEHEVRFRPAILSEASVSAIVRFTWKNAATGKREHGVFKVLKPYIPRYFAEDMQILQGLAEYFGSKLDDYGLSGDVLADTFTKVRRLLEHEVNLPGEQKTLVLAAQMYRSVRGIRVPRVIPELCTDDITAMSEELGVKVTDVSHVLSKWKRARIAERLIEALVAQPLFSAEKDALFHADPHAGNLSYDPKSGDLVIFDWALTERITQHQRRVLALLFAYMALRDRVGVAQQIELLKQNANGRGAASQQVREQVDAFVDQLPLSRLPSAIDAMRLLEKLAMSGVKFPAPLIMLSKVMLMLDGILTDLGASNNAMGIGIARHLLRQSFSNRKLLAFPIRLNDLLSLECSAALLGARLWIRGEEVLVSAIFPERKALALASAATV